MNAPFLDFYRDNKISPVHQDVSDIEKHYSRRDHLYRRLGLPPIAFTGKRIIEFGCGSGHNALYVSSRKPAELLLIDGSPIAVADAQWVREAFIRHSEILEYRGATAEIIICEGVIPHQEKPREYLKHVASFVEPSGVLVITVADYFGILSEVIRRLIRDALVSQKASIEDQLKVIRPIFASHAAHLPGMSRPVDDWIIDTIIQPWYHPLFPMDEAIETLSDDFEVLGTSPQFLTDWRWYKDVWGNQSEINERAIEQYRLHRLNLLDARLPPQCSYSMNNVEISNIAFDLFQTMRAIENDGAQPNWRTIAKQCRRLAMLAPSISRALHCAARFFEDHSMPLDAFAPWFGHGQQYISFVRNP